MNARLRALVIAAVVAVAVAVSLQLWLEHGRIGALQTSLQAFVDGPAFEEFRSRCHSDPTHIEPFVPSGDTHDGPLIEVYGYDGGLQPAVPNAPVFSTDLADRMRGKLSAAGSYSSPNGTGAEIGIATPWRNGNCALMLVRLPPKPGEGPSEQIEIIAGGLLAGAIAWMLAGVLWRKRA